VPEVGRQIVSDLSCRCDGNMFSIMGTGPIRSYAWGLKLRGLSGRLWQRRCMWCIVVVMGRATMHPNCTCMGN
jgi:hypothetical protein